MNTKFASCTSIGHNEPLRRAIAVILLLAAGPGWGLARAAGGAEAVAGGGGGGAVAVVESGGEEGAAGTVGAAVAHADARARKEAAWLGLAAEEAPEALSAQLNLPSGAGLVVSYLDPKGPAATAGLQKNDLLAKLDDQSLVHPAQLRKLVQARKPGDTVRITYFRGGKEEKATVTLGKTDASFEYIPDLGPAGVHLRELQERLRDPQLRENLRGQMKALRDNLHDLNINGQVQSEVRRSMEEAQRAIREALQQMTNAGAALGPARKTLQELARKNVLVDHHSTVTVRSTGEDNRSLVQTDDWGTIVLVRNPKLHLTAHDKAGKLLFDGEIETREQRDAVPREVWEKTEPLVEKMDAPAHKQVEVEEPH